MSAAAIAAALTEALDAAAARETGGACVLVSMHWELLAPAASGEARVSVERKTRTLMFLNATFVGAGGARIATAASVHKIVE